VIAFGEAATACLETLQKFSEKLCVMVAYYPTSLRDPNISIPDGVKFLVHLASSASNGMSRKPVMQHQRRTMTKRVSEDLETGGRLKLACPTYNYDDVKPGFAEYDLDEYDKVASRISWSRSLDTVRAAFNIEVDLEKIWEDHVELEFVTRDAEATMATMVPSPYVNHVPTLTGGIGKKDLTRFYADFFIPSNPPSLKMKLLSRTIGSDRVVDEMFISFEHTQEVPWMIPGVPPTNKMVEVAAVSVVCIRGGKLYHEHIYWDQASVLVQIGLLDPMLIPEAFKGSVTRLPVVGRESARKVLDEESEPSNELIANW